MVSTSQSFNWTVNPVVNLTTPADQNNNEGDNVSLQMTAADTLYRTLTYRAVGLPSGLSINSGTGLISGTIASGNPSGGPYVATVTASDSIYSSSVNFNWNVTDTAALTMTAPSTQTNVAGDSVNMHINASDPDGDALTYSAANLPDGLDIDPASGIISGVIADDAPSETPYAVTVTATDGNGQSVSQTFNWLVNPPAVTAQSVSANLTEGVDPGSFTLATFTTPDVNSLPDDFTATIDYGDGNTDTGSISGGNGSFTVTGDHVYAEKGSYAITVQIYDSLTGGTATASTTATVADATLNLTGGFQLGDPMSNPLTAFTLASFTDDNSNAPASDYSVTINWGDGNQTSGNYLQNAGDGTYLIVAPHSYTLPSGQVGPLTYTVAMTLTDADGSSASTTSTIVVGQLKAGVSATMGGWLFQDQNSYAKAGDFVADGQSGVALINWGDGTSSEGTVTGGPGNGSGPVLFSVQGTHNYAQDSYGQLNGQYQITVTLTDTDGNTLTGTQYVSVVRTQESLDVANLDISSSLIVSNAPVAAFTVPDATDGVSEFTALIDWGDGNTSSGTIQEVSPGLFVVLGSHTYAAYDWYTMTVTISQGWGGMATDVKGSKEAGGTPKVQFWATPLKPIGGRSTYEKVQTLEVSRWGNAFQNVKTKPKFVKTFINTNNQRFYVQVYDPVAWKNPNKKTIQVYVETSSDIGQDITLTRQVQANVYKSAPLLLTTFPVDKKAEAGQTFYVKLGDTVRATYDELDAEATVPVLKVVHLQINILRVANGGDLVATKAEVKADYFIANKIYAVAGIRFIIDQIQYVNPPAGVVLKNNINKTQNGLVSHLYFFALDDQKDGFGKFRMTDEEKALLRAEPSAH